MQRKLFATLVIALFLLSILAVARPVSAHFTLGDYTPTMRFRKNDFDPHVAGPLAYVWPGGGLAAYTGTLAGFPPGYQTPFPGGNPPGQVSTIYQLEGRLSPFGAILTSTDDHPNRGPLIFALNFSTPCKFGWNDVDNNCGREQVPPNPTPFCGPGVSYCANYTGVTIYIPPEFDLSSAMSNPGLVESTFGSTANDLVITKADKWDPWGPYWWILHVEGDIHWWPQHDYREWYYIRINDVIAPKIAGKYFFKVFLSDQFFNFVYPGMQRTFEINGFQCNPAPGVCLNGPDRFTAFRVPFSGPTNATVSVENWPVLLVKGDVDPGTIIGRIRYGSYNISLYQRPIDLPGKVWAEGVAEDGRPLWGMAHFNQSAQGHYELEGLAPGTYDLYASAAGYPTQLIAEGISVLPAQAFQRDGYINPGPQIHGRIYSKHQFAEQPWPTAPRPVYVEIYNSNEYKDENVVAYSPLNLTHPPYMTYDWDMFHSIPTPRPIAYPWSALFAAWGKPLANGSYYKQNFTKPPANPNYISHPNATCGGKFDQCGKPNGVGQAQYWWVDAAGTFTNGGGSSSFIFRFGAKGLYGAPTDMDGHVPQTLATWVNGLEPGRYWLRGWINGYTQTLQDGVTLDEYSFEVGKYEWAGDIFTPMDLRVGSTIIKTVHFHDKRNTLEDCPINGCAGNRAQGLSTGPRFLIAEVRDNEGKLAGMNFTIVNDCQYDPDITDCARTADLIDFVTVQINGFGMMGPDLVGVKYSYFRYQGYRDYGLHAGTYKVYVYMRGYLQSDQESISLTLSGNPASISNHVHRGARLNITANSIDWENPRVERPWQFPGARFRIYVFNSMGESRFYVGYTNFNAAGGGRSDDPNKQPACFIQSFDPPFCPTGNPQTINPTDQLGDTFIINAWDGFIAADSLGPDKVPFFTSLLLGGNFRPWWDSGGFLYNPGLYRFGGAENFKPNSALASDTYAVFGFTYGYVQHKGFSEYATEGGFGNAILNLLKGVNITINIPLKREGVLTPTDFNMTMRVRVFDDAGNLVATASSKGPDNGCINLYCSDLATASDTFTFFGLGRFTGSNRNPLANSPFDTLSDSSAVFGNFPHAGRKGAPTFETYYVDPFASSPSFDNGLLTIDGTTRETGDTFLWHGTWSVGPSGSSVRGWQAFDSDPDRDFVSNFATFQFNRNGWGLFEWKTWIPFGTDEVRVLIAGIYDPFGDPLDDFNAGILHTKAWDSATETGMKVASMWYGIDGFSSTFLNSYSGTWTIEVDTWNEYPKPNFQTRPRLSPPISNWYPPVEGLLEGESFHLIPGHPADPFGYTGSSLAPNGLGPYYQRSLWAVPNAHLGAETSVVNELDKRGHITGHVYAYVRGGELRTQSWLIVQASSENLTFTTRTWDSIYDMYLPAGDYDLIVYAWTPESNIGYYTISSPIHISDGQSTTGITFELKQSGILIPEFKTVTLVYFSALAASIYLLRRRRRP